MEKFEKFKKMLDDNVPFSFAKFNDGEVGLMTNHKTIASRGYQCGGERIQELCIQAAKHVQKNYYVGIPCASCDKTFRDRFKKIAGDDSDNFVLANVFINENITKSLEFFKKVFQNKKITFVCSENADVNKLPFKVSSVFYTKHKDSFDEYDRLKDGWKIMKPGDIAIFCTGPLGRILCYEWFRHNPHITCLCLGSYFDPYTQGKAYLYHQGTLGRCNSCNRNYLADLPFSEEFFDGCKTLDCYYNFQLQPNLPLNIKRSKLRSFLKYGNKERKLLAYSILIQGKTPVELQKKYCDGMIALFPNYAEPYYHKSFLYKENSEERCDQLLKASKIPYDDQKYAEKSIYDWKIDFALVINCFYCNKMKESYLASTRLLTNKLYPSYLEARILDNDRYPKIYYTP